MSKALMPQLPEDLRALTSLRFVAAGMIFLLHLREFAPDLGPWIEPAAMNQGVSFFFVLSGFILSHAYRHRPPDMTLFMRSRFARLYPTHLATLALILIALPFPAARFQNLTPVETWMAALAKLTLAEAWLPIDKVARTFNAVSWSISAEMAFYIAFPLLLLSMRRHPVATLASAFALSLGVYAVGLAFRLEAAAVGFTPTLYALGTFHPFARGSEFVLGMAAYRLLTPWLMARASGTALEATVLALSATWLFVVVPPVNAFAEGAFYVWFHCAGSAWVFAGVIAVIACERGKVAKLLSLRPFVRLGEVSFAFYMVHEVALRVLRLRFGEHPPVLGAFALALLLAFAMHYAVERPGRAWLLARGTDQKTKATAAI